ncbi:type 2 periplasmic-binding domain-containing protein [Desulfogranum mediterraneum]|uniref:hypothetical protein n=1 Tax=Desulfogranum mediterraneum TaxID=160661 RepID=UPI0004042FC6|nr:hypothetical protein [Desulfogranum mediterraneum]
MNHLARDPSKPPMQFRDAEGSLRGFEVDYLEAIAPAATAIGRARLRKFATLPEAVTALQAGELETLTCDGPLAGHLMQEDKGATSSCSLSWSRNAPITTGLS